MALGVAIEVIASRLGHKCDAQLQRRSSDRLADVEVSNGFLEASTALALERAANAQLKAELANLERAKLEARLQPRMVSQEQWDFIQTLRGRFEAISIAHETDAEPWWYADSLMAAFSSVGIRVGMYRREAGIHTFGMMVYEPNGFDGGRPRTVELLTEAVRFGDMPTGSVAIITGMPLDIEAPTELPMIIVGGRMPVIPKWVPLDRPAASEADEESP